MIEVKFAKYETYFKAYQWCIEVFGEPGWTSGWICNYFGMETDSNALFFRNKEDAVLCRLMWSCN